ncbi:SseB family protein [Lentibacter algarum]|uniref:SseB family protein n=1 Tax=Lentibacter algarum TaxID=576131 RepID=UPI001C08791C|nr:SseB family protein [Lentibacter algarum]MBU2983484.1 SseB family protein [Lentibacter algarum]
MTKPTPLDRAHAIMMKAPDDEDARLAYYAMLADTEIFLLLEDEPEGDVIEPQFADLDEGSFVLGFDSNERLTKFANGAAPYAAVSCRVLAEMLTEQEAGLALNLGVAESSIVLPLEAMVWMQTALDEAPQEQQAQQGGSAIGTLVSPNVPEVLLHTLDAKLVRAAGLAKVAYLCGQEDGGLLLAVLGADEPSQAPLAKAASEALVFSGLDDLMLDVAFYNDAPGLREQFSRVGMRFEIPEPPKAKPVQAPGSDPKKPPKLR